MVRVIDCSVAIKWFVLEPGRVTALKILKGVLETPENYAVPELFYFELAHTFHKILPHPSKEHLELMHQLFLIAIPRFSMTPELLYETRSFQILGLSGYDGAYVGLAKLVKGKWATFDREAYRVVQHTELAELLS